MTSLTKPTVTSRWLRANLWLHRWSSLIATLPFLILCLTGTILIFHDEIDSALGVLPPSPGVAVNEQPLNQAVDNALSAVPEERVALIGFDHEEHPGLLLIGTIPTTDSNFQRMSRRYAHLETAELTTEFEQQRGTFTGLLFELHAQWFLGPAGAFVGGLIGILVFVSLLTGVVVYGPHARRVSFGEIRNKGARLKQLDLHNFIGAVVLGWALTVAITGFFLGGGTIITGMWAQNNLMANQPLETGVVIDERHPPIDVDSVKQAALTIMPPDWSIEMIIWPNTNLTSKHNYAVRIKGHGLDERLFRVILVSAISGDVIETIELPWFIKIIALSQPLHFGDYGGLALKLLWTSCAWLTLFITGNGAWLWWTRRRKSKEHSATLPATEGATA